MRKTLVASLVAGVVAIALGAFFLRLQPSGTATIFREGSRVVARNTPLFFRGSGLRCRVALLGGRLTFDGDELASSSTNDEFTAHVRFTYTLPQAVPPSWVAGDWCSSLAQSVATSAARTGARVSALELLDHRRESGDRIAATIEQDLRAASVVATAVSARIDLPDGFERVRPVDAIASRARAASPVIFIGLDGADWNLLDGYMASGAMPNLRKLVNDGTRGPLQTELPPLSPIVWTTMMTGVSPLEHQILDFTRFNPHTHDKEPITSDERRAPAIWNMLTYAGKSAAVFGLWATFAAEPVHAIHVTDRLFTFLYTSGERPAGVVYPRRRQQWAEQHVAEAERAVDLAKMREYLPSLSEAEFADAVKTSNPYADPAAALRRILVETEIYRRLSLDYLRNRSRLPDLTIVYLQGTDSIGHEFAPFAPPKQPGISQADFHRYSSVPEKYFRYIDTILGDYIAIAARAGAVIAIASDHGFRWKEGRPAEISSTATATAAKWHRNEGIFVLSGSRLPHNPKGIRDICGVLLALTGTPNDDYARYFHRAAAPPAPGANSGSAEELAKLRALGYIGSNEATRPAVPQNDTKTGGAYNNAGLILRNDRRIDEAISSFERAIAIEPHYASAMWNLSQTLYDAHRDLDRADALLIAALQNGLADGPRFVIVRSIDYQRSGRADRSLRLLEQAVAASPANPELRMFRGRYRMEHQQCGEALADFLAAEQQQPSNALAFASAGLAQMCLGDQAAARGSFARARALDPTLQLPSF